ncbi:MAG: alpha-glucan family phosphorylase [Candidatus Omnitrophota bacterium]|nr:alpha-glucan family phosphorylase [Candidatus Omnitrophota bacterium]
MTQPQPPTMVAYFSMEAGLDPAIPTYSGGLGVLAGDTLRSAADLRVPLVGISLLHRKGYFRQHLDPSGQQTESAVEWRPEQHFEALPPIVTVTIENRPVQIHAWRYLVRGLSGHTIPVYLLDTALPDNTPWDQALTDHLYAGDDRYRLAQEVVLGMGGVAMLHALGYEGLYYHMNEGHSALLAIALLERQASPRGLAQVSDADVEAVRSQCIFTTHTPVPAGHDKFPLPLVKRIVGPAYAAALEAAHGCVDGTLNMTYLALFFSHYINGVAMRHGEISRDMFPTYPINAITNGVHAVTWTCPSFCELFDRYIAQWRSDNLYLRYAMDIPLHEIEKAHVQAKRALLAEVAQRTGVHLDETVLTVGFARRATPYKRADLLFTNLDRLRALSRTIGPVQVLYAGKAHPKDTEGKAMIRRIYQAAMALGDDVRVLYLEEYDMALAQQLCAGVDLWLNTPRQPQEASGTSGMKAALNGVPSLSTLDGWWIEGHIEGVTGWSIGDGQEPPGDSSSEVASLYDKLERVIVPMFYGRPAAFVEVMRSTIALNGSFFNTQRMVSQYVTNAYFPAISAPAPATATAR